MSKRDDQNSRLAATRRGARPPAPQPQSAAQSEIRNPKSEIAGGVSRRQMLKLLGASAALALGVPGCKRKPHREIVSRPEFTGLGGQSGVANPQLPGQVYHYASTWTEGPYPYGMLVKTVDGRPVKIDGNPDHPINRGASSPAMQASILSLYDPDRLKGPLRRGKPVTWEQADAEILAALRQAKSVVLMTLASQTGVVENLFAHCQAKLRGFHHFVHETIHDNQRRRTWSKIYPNVDQLEPRFDKARTILSFDCDFLGSDGDTATNIQRFAAGRASTDRDGAVRQISRLYAIESAVTATSALADHRILIKPSAMADFALALCEFLEWPDNRYWAKKILSDIPATAARFGISGGVLAGIVGDLSDKDSQVVCVAGSHLPAQAHAAVSLLNVLTSDHNAMAWGWSGTKYATETGQVEALLSKGVDVLIMLGVNPVYDWPGNSDFRQLIDKAGLSVAHGLYLDETLSASTFALPSHHNLESWGSASEWGLSFSLFQPVIHPLFDTRQEQQSVFNWLNGLVPGENYFKFKDWQDFLRQYTLGSYNILDQTDSSSQPDPAITGSGKVPTSQSATTQPVTSQPGATRPEDRIPPSKDDLIWQQLLQRGSYFPEIGPELPGFWSHGGNIVPERADRIARQGVPAASPNGPNPQSANRNPKSPYELVILPHHAIYDGRFANNAWLQELPHPITRAVWGNFATISPATATQLGVVEGDVVRVTVVDRSVELPVLIQPGTADGVVVTTLGHGRTAGGSVAIEAGGVNVAPLLGRENPDAPRVAFNVQVVKVDHPDVSAMRGRRNLSDADTDYRIKATDGAGPFPPVRTQREFSQHGRPIALAGTLAEYRADPAGFVQRLRLHPLPKKIDTFASPYDYAKGHKWAMAIDLSACVGCGACVIACQAENNIPVVGRDQCGNGRNMHWLRIDCYRDGLDPANPTFRFQPMLCQQCDTAPCETVCPVNATAHSPEGLNEMAYNRCVGTRYCQNNCPYKVRRFNFLRWHQFRLREADQELAFNPQVSVRSIGVMEKCTFCVQRINAAKFRAFNEGRKLVDGEIQTACQQACPAGAIVFGDANDPASRVAKLRQSPRAYHVLEELNTKPGVTYLAKIFNPNPAVKDEPKTE